MNRLNSVKCTTKTGHTWTTSVSANTTEAKAIAYFMGQFVDISPDPEKEKMDMVISVKFEAAQTPILKYKIGDRVTFTNSQGVIFENKTILGFCSEESNLHQYGYRYYLDKDSYWMPVEEKRLSLETPTQP